MKELRILKEKVEHLEDQKLQYEKKLKATKVNKACRNKCRLIQTGVSWST